MRKIGWRVGRNSEPHIFTDMGALAETLSSVINSIIEEHNDLVDEIRALKEIVKPMDEGDSRMNKQGKFIVFEGIDGSGTTTQIDLVAKELESRGIKCVKTCEPTSSAIGQLLDRVLKQEEGQDWDETTRMLLFAADRSYHAKQIQKWVDMGYYVLCDRYRISSFAYQGNSLEGDWFDEMFSINKKFLNPSMTFFIDTPVEICMERIGTRNEQREIYEKEETLRRVRHSYLLYKYDMEIINGNRNRNDIMIDIVGKILANES